MRSWLLLLAACATDPTTQDEPALFEGTICAWDDDDTPDLAGTLDGSAEGWLCPAGDHDWYRVDVPAGHGVAEVSLSLPPSEDGALLALTWSLWADGADTPVGAPEPGEVVLPGTTLTLSHPVSPGVWLLQVRDVVDGAADETPPYALTVVTHPEPDAHEPNDAEPTEAGAGAWEGALSTRGDRDRYRVPLLAGELFTATLTSQHEATTPTLTILNGTEQPLHALTVYDAPETWAWTADADTTLELLVADDDACEHGLGETYTLDLEIVPDPDPSEPNDHPTVATALGTASCGDTWQSLPIRSGALSASGDVDWYQLELSDCTPGILEVDLAFTGQSPGSTLDVALRLLRGDPASPCQIDQDCQVLARFCDDDADCELYGNLCLPQGQCAGAGVCLPDETCAATTLLEVAEPGATNAVLSAPLVGTDTAWLTVQDHRGDDRTLATYELDVRTLAEPDPREPDNVYTAGPPTSSDAGLHTARATTVPVHDCTLGDCCDDTTWVDGTLATAHDQDWFRYEHPCPGEDCMLRLHWRSDAGPADHFFQVWRGTRLWFDQLAGTADLPAQAERFGTYGGLTDQDQCFYAYQGHNGSPYSYHLSVRDTIWVSRNDPQGGTWDWSAAQTYGFCLEKLAAGCESPCQLLPQGCNP